MTFVKKNVLNTLVNVALPQGATEGGLDQEFPTFSIPFLTWSQKGAWVTTRLFLSFLLAKTTHLANICSWSSFSCHKNIKTSIMKYFRIHFAVHGAITWIRILLCFNMTGETFESKLDNWLIEGLRWNLDLLLPPAQSASYPIYFVCIYHQLPTANILARELQKTLISTAVSVQEKWRVISGSSSVGLQSTYPAKSSYHLCRSITGFNQHLTINMTKGEFASHSPPDLLLLQSPNLS